MTKAAGQSALQGPKFKGPRVCVLLATRIGRRRRVLASSTAQFHLPLFCITFRGIFLCNWTLNYCVGSVSFIIHSFIRLRSRRLQIFSKHINLQLMRQLHLGSDHFLHPQKASVNRLGSLSSAILVSFCRELEHTGNIFCMAPLQAS